MATKNQDIKIDDSSFFTPGKGVNQLMISIFIWGITGVVYKTASLIIKCAPYEAICFICSLLLSVVAGIFINRKLLKNFEGTTRFFFGLANVLILYTSANGFQTAYCFVSSPSSGEVKCASFIPFMEARPWLPDLFHKEEINALDMENRRLQSELEDSRSGNNNSNEKLIQELQSLRDQNSKLENQHRADLQALVNVQPVKTDNNAQPDNSNLYAQIDTLRNRISAFNEKKRIWVNITAGRYDSDVRPTVTRATHDVNYFAFLFYSTIDESLFVKMP